MIISIVALVISVVTLGLVVFLELRKQKQIRDLKRKTNAALTTVGEEIEILQSKTVEAKQRIDKSFEREMNLTGMVGRLKNEVLELKGAEPPKPPVKKTTKKKKEETKDVPVQNDQENDSGK